MAGVILRSSTGAGVVVAVGQAQQARLGVGVVAPLAPEARRVLVRGRVHPAAGVAGDRACVLRED